MNLHFEEFKKDKYKDYIDMYKEFIKYNSDLVPDILEIKCNSEEDYSKVLNEIENRLIGKHEDIDWYFDGYYYLVYDDNELVGLGCIRNNLTPKGYDIWGNIAYGVRPTKRNKGYGTQIAKMLVEEARKMNIEEIILCHYESNEISPIIFKKIGAQYINTILSPYSKKKILRYNI